MLRLMNPRWFFAMANSFLTDFVAILNNDPLHSLCVHNHVLRFCSTSIIEVIIYLCAQRHPITPAASTSKSATKQQKLISSQQRPL